MSKIIISAGFGRGFSEEFEHRIDPVLVDCLEQIADIPSSKAAATKRREIYNLMKARFEQIGLGDEGYDPTELSLVDIPSGTRFVIEEYDGSEYIIDETALRFVAP